MSHSGQTVTKTTCPYCGVGCGVSVLKEANGKVTVKGDDTHPANYGRLCSKGSALADTIELENRLLYPTVNGQATAWPDAIAVTASRFQETIKTYGRDSVAFYVSGQLLTEDYYVANKLMKGFIGSGNIDTNSRLCMSSAVAGHKRAFGSDTVPCSYEDLELADLVILIGSNTAWCHPVAFQRISKAKQDRPNMKVVVIDPRRTATCEIADLHLPLNIGTDVMLFNGLLNYLRKEDCLDWQFLEKATEGFGAVLSALKQGRYDIAHVAEYCGVKADELAKFYQMFARTEKTVSVFSQGVNQSSAGVDKVNAIINCHLATGRIGRPGAGPFSITGQPNAMGGREVGGLANTLAAHMDFDKAQLVSEFWQTDTIATEPGLKAIDLFRAIDAGKIKALWIMATNPVVSLPDADGVKRALEKLDFLVVSDCEAKTDTTRYAHVLLPALGWGEKAGTVTNSERRISRQRAFLSAPGEAKPDWWIVTEVAKAMGFEKSFAYLSVDDVFREHAALSAFNNKGTRDFDIGGLQKISKPAYDALAPIQWPVNEANATGTPQMFRDGKFFTPSRKARFIVIEPRLPVNKTSNEYPLILNTGRIRDQWHTMTRTARSPRLNAHTLEPVIEIHPSDARISGIQDGSLACISSLWGKLIGRVLISENQKPGSVFVPIHWNDQYSARARVDAVVNPEVDAISGQPELKHTPVKIEPFEAMWHGFVLTRDAWTATNFDYWTKAKGKECWRYEFASNTAERDWPAWSREKLGNAGEWIDYFDKTGGVYRGALIRNERLIASVFISPNHLLPTRAWLESLFANEKIDGTDRMSLLAGRPAKGSVDQGPVVCSCFSVGVNTLVDAIQKQGLVSIEGIGKALKAGTNCGSCVPEIKTLIHRYARDAG